MQYFDAVRGESEARTELYKSTVREHWSFQQSRAQRIVPTFKIKYLRALTKKLVNNRGNYTVNCLYRQLVMQRSKVVGRFPARAYTTRVAELEKPRVYPYSREVQV